MSRYLIVTLPLTGHAYRALAVADELSARGHEVAWCGPKAYFGPLLGPDATLFPTGTRFLRDQAGHGIAALKSLWQEYVIPMARFMLPSVGRAVRDYQPDLVVVDQHALAGALAAHRDGLAWATLVTQAMELTHPLAALPRVDAWVRAQIASVCAEAGVTDVGFDPLFSPYLVIAFTTSALTGSRPFPPHFVLVGAAMLERPVPFAWDLLDPARRKVLITVGTLATDIAGDFYRRAAAAVGPLGGSVQTIIAGPPALLPDPPQSVLLLPMVPMLALLPKLDVVVSHSGMNTVSEALAHGVPLILAPIRHDQPVVAAQVVKAGAGIRVPFSRVRPGELREALVRTLDDPSYRSAALRIRDSFAAAGGAAAAASRLENVVGLTGGRHGTRVVHHGIQPQRDDTGHLRRDAIHAGQDADRRRSGPAHAQRAAVPVRRRQEGDGHRPRGGPAAGQRVDSGGIRLAAARGDGGLRLQPANRRA